MGGNTKKWGKEKSKVRSRRKKQIAKKKRRKDY